MRFGLVGTGFWAETCHAPALAAARGVQFAGVWGRDPAKARALGDEFGVTAAGSFDELLSGVDALSFAVPPDVQAPLAARAADAGRHLLLEKPVATSLTAAENVVAEADRTGVATLVFLTNRFSPELADWVEEVAGSEWTGAVANWVVGPIDAPDNPFRGSAWRRERGALWDVGPHALSLILPAMPAIESVSATAGRADLVAMTLRHAGGEVTTLTLTMNAPRGADFVDLRLWGPAGIARKPESSTRAVDGLANALGSLVSMAESGIRSAPCDVRFGRDIVRILAAAEHSASTGSAVPLG